MTELENEEIERSQMSDDAFVDELIGHIVNPCVSKNEEGEVLNLRSTYLRMARKALETLVDPAAKTKLEDTIRLWEKFAAEELSR
jgi:hypothetical protein